jgi:hypothetical protein
VLTGLYHQVIVKINTCRSLKEQGGAQVPLPCKTKAKTTRERMDTMNRQVIKWGLNLAMGAAFLVSFITGMFKFTFFMRLSGLTTLVLPIALMSEIHDWSGFLLGIFVACHLILNRAWIMTMTRKILSGEKMPP